MNNTPAAAPQQPGVDVGPMIADIEKRLPKNLLDIFKKTILAGERLMFDKASHQMMVDQLNQPGPMAKKASDGIVSVVFMLWQQSNETVPPQIIVPAAITLAYRAFEFLQDSQDPEATLTVLGDLLDETYSSILDKLGATPEQIEQFLQQQNAGPATGMIGAAR
ncbi:MAG TPA: hypothetical protein VIT92_16675 [Burkholderiaceae bacterium]